MSYKASRIIFFFLSLFEIKLLFMNIVINSNSIKKEYEYFDNKDAQTYNDQIIESAICDTKWAKYTQ